MRLACSYLKLLPLDQLKIDVSFIKNVLTDPDDAAIILKKAVTPSFDMIEH
jgi:EAL domain-containing protein (putative c-di-GMP-specific phosphodiesterase class I)